MSGLYSMTQAFDELFNSYEAIDSMEFPSDGNGNYTDDDGNIIDPEQFRSDMREAWFDTLDAMEQDIEEKAANVAIYIKNITAEAESIKAEENRLKARRLAKERAASRMKEYILSCMDMSRLSKIERASVCVSVRSNPESVHISDENAFIGWAETHEYDHLLRYHAPDVNKTAVKAFLKAGNEAPGAELTRGRSVVIK